MHCFHISVNNDDYKSKSEILLQKLSERAEEEELMPVLVMSMTVCIGRSICQLYNWRYKKLGNLPHVSLWSEFRAANAGFFFDFQLVNVEDFNGVGESEPNPYFYQV